MKMAISPGKAEDVEIIDPFDCWRDAMVLPDIDSSIGYFALETGGGCETKRNIVVNVKDPIVMYNKVPFVIGFDRDRAIGTFHIQHGSLSSQRSGSHLRKILSD
jgi:hypothetical protein